MVSLASMATKRPRWKSELIGWAKVLVVVFLIRFFVIHPFRIPSGSMRNTLLEGDWLFANKFIYGLKIPWTSHWFCRFADPKQGDIVIFRHPLEGRDLIKRCIAVGGDVVEIRNKKVYVNGEELTEPYTHPSGRRTYPGLEYQGDYERSWEDGRFLRSPYVRDNFGPVTVPEGHLFMLGDNRDNSSDSRFWGPLPIDQIKGKAMIIYFSYVPPWYNIFKNPVKNVRWSRIGDIIR